MRCNPMITGCRRRLQCDHPLVRLLGDADLAGAGCSSTASAAVIVELLWSMADMIDSEYAADIAGYRRQGPTARTTWLPPSDEEQLLLDLGDQDFF